MSGSLTATAVLILLSFAVCAQDTAQDRTEGGAATTRELEASEDPLQKQQVETAGTATEEAEATSDLEFYGSIRLRYRHIDTGGSLWEDNGSRLGLNGWVEIAPSTWLFGRYELGFNLLTELGVDRFAYQADQELGDTLFTRLGYLGLQTDTQLLVFGKNWSTYYQVASFTDRFDSLGGEASGTYNAFTDGGPSGTGRADGVLQTRLHFNIFQQYNNLKPLAVNLQLQYREPIPGIPDGQYGLGFGASTILEAWNNLSIGIAYNRSSIDLDAIPVSNRRGLTGSMSALLLGGRWFDDDWYIGTTLSRSDNLQTTDEGTYFSGTGVELYAQYQVASNIWLTAGLNYLSPDSDQPRTGDYLLSYGVLGLRYAIEGFSRMLYLESRIDKGRTQDGRSFGNQLIAGIRWGF